MYPSRYSDLTNLNTCLKAVRVNTSIHGLVMRTRVTHEYENNNQEPREILYCFPFNFKDLLVSVECDIDGLKLKGSVKDKTAANAEYEETLSKGGIAFELEQRADGVLRSMLGNLKSGKKASVTLEYITLLRPENSNLRFHFPLTIGKRYGNASAVFESGEEPETSSDALYALQISVEINGILAHAAEIECNYPKAQISRESENKVIISLTDGIVGSDFAVTLKKLPEISAQLVCEELSNGYAVAVSQEIQKSDASNKQPPALKILVDCSGSMGGAGISSARKALTNLIAKLQPHTRISLSFFGSHYQSILQDVDVSDFLVKRALRRSLSSMDANLGGTELRNALGQIIYERKEQQIGCPILLITDGEIWKTEHCLNLVRNSNHRLYIIGVGLTPNTGFLKKLAEQTEGALECVSPNDDMTVAVQNIIAKTIQGSPKRIEIAWIPSALYTAGDQWGYEGETAWNFAFFSSKPDTVFADNRLALELQDSAIAIKDLTRVAALNHLWDMAPGTERTQWAVTNKLMSDSTAWILTDNETLRDDEPLEPLITESTPQPDANSISEFACTDRIHMAFYDRSAPPVNMCCSHITSSGNASVNPLQRSRRIMRSAAAPTSFSRIRNIAEPKIDERCLFRITEKQVHLLRNARIDQLTALLSKLCSDPALLNEILNEVPEEARGSFLNHLRNWLCDGEKGDEITRSLDSVFNQLFVRMIDF